MRALFWSPGKGLSCGNGRLAKYHDLDRSHPLFDLMVDRQIRSGILNKLAAALRRRGRLCVAVVHARWAQYPSGPRTVEEARACLPKGDEFATGLVPETDVLRAALGEDK